MRKDKRRTFRHVDATPAADTDNQVWGEIACALRAAVHGLAREVRLDGIEHVAFNARALEMLVEHGKRVAGSEARVGTDQRLRSETRRDGTDCGSLPLAEQDFSRQPQYRKRVHIGGHVEILWRLGALWAVILYHIV
jgi:hypothetical protein